MDRQVCPSEAEGSFEVRTLSQLFQAFFAHHLGPLGQNTHVLLFPGETGTGARIADAPEKGQFKLRLGSREFQWQLPLDSVLLSKTCTNCMHECKGSWDFCPWCGTRLVAQGNE